MENILVQLGIILFLIGLLTGFVVPKLANPLQVAGQPPAGGFERHVPRSSWSAMAEA